MVCHREIVNNTDSDFVGKTKRRIGKPAELLQFEQRCGREHGAPHLIQVFVSEQVRVVGRKLGAQQIHVVPQEQPELPRIKRQTEVDVTQREYAVTELDPELSVFEGDAVLIRQEGNSSGWSYLP